MSACSAKEISYSSDVSWLIDVLELNEQSVVADVGAGDGQQAIQLAQYIGPGGEVYATELGDETLQRLRRNIERSEVENITVVAGDPARTNLSAMCCDAVYLRRVYHHVAQPDSMNLSLMESLKPGGRLAIMDFEPSGEEGAPGERDEGRSHGITTDTLIEELTAAGFEQIGEVEFSGRYYYVVFQKPGRN
ncbi:MAG: methyltransferase domain-containing protein [Bacteroidetes bacterium]|nr:methyltransferase domain-containing protein [Bacteroidota bacterium]